MKTNLGFFTVLILFPLTNFGQDVLFKESFGNGQTGAVIQSEYANYDSPDQLNIDSIEIFLGRGNNSSTGYLEASGANFVQLEGHFNWDGITPLSDTLFIHNIDTRGFTNIHLSFGIFNRTGWSGISNHAFEGFYSTDHGQKWIQIDKNNTIDGNHFPSNNTWGWVSLGDTLPAVENLHILILNPTENDHTCLIDDIMITGFVPDEEPPTNPSNLEAINIDINSVDLFWEASTDNHRISHYLLYKNGNPYLKTRNPFIQLKYQTAGSQAKFSVTAYDNAGNASGISNAISVTFLERPAGYKYPWQIQQAEVLPEGNLKWTPKSFQFQTGTSIRYIDFENGNDNSDGLSKASAWKHHPWDENATGNAATCSGINTYIFKQGVIYRGTLVAAQSGSLIEPVRLTSDPTWGTGEACIFGSRCFTGGWEKADETTAPGIPDPSNVWYLDLPISTTKYICEVEGENYRPIHLARSPNYEESPDDPVEKWWRWTKKDIVNNGQNIWLTDANNLIQEDPEFYKGASVYSQEDAWVMCSVRFLDVLEWDPENNRVKMGHTKFGGKNCRYFIENTPYLLDTTNEYYFDKESKRLFLRLANDKNPNTAIIEVAEREQLIEIHNKHHIEISGITLGLTTSEKIRQSEADAKSAIRMTGVCTNISIKNNKFVYQNGGVSLHSLGSSEDNSHSIVICDNEFHEIGDLSLALSTGGIFLDDIRILRNKLTNVGFRQLGRQWSSIPAVYGQFNYAEVAGNIIDYSWGNGIDIFWGKSKISDVYVPFVRGLIHHNQASNTVFGTNDYGGIESWQGGPTFCYNNRSHNSPGYRHYDETSLGYAFYFDGCFKHYVFNNIASGTSHNRTATSFHQVLGYYNMFIHNTAHNTRNMFDSAPGLGLNGHNTYLSNIAEDIEVFFWHKVPSEYIPFDSYGYNLSSNQEFKASLEDKTKYYNLNTFTDKLKGYSTQLTQTAWNAGKTVLENADNFDFRPKSAGEAMDRGVIFFVPFPLAKVVGEWHFYKHPADSSLIRSDNLYLTEDFNNRETYQLVPKNHLKAHNVSLTSFQKGFLEDWTEGSLEFDGSSVYCSADHYEIIQVKSNNLDMNTNDFILETYIKPDTSNRKSTIVSKTNGIDGYKLGLDESGFVEIVLYTGGAETITQNSKVNINDGQWHHLLVEVLRNSGMNIYIDGKVSNGSLNGAMPDASLSLSNNADFLVGKGMDNLYYKGCMDFLRVSRANLFDAKTTLHELYYWQSNGPFLYDMTGSSPIGKRDAGALEAGEKLCEMSINPSKLEFDDAASCQILTVDALFGFELLTPEGDIFTTDTREDTISVFVEENELSYELYDNVSIFGCHETQFIPVIQAPGPCEFSIESEELTIDHARQTIKIAVQTNGVLSISCSSTFAFERLDPTADTIIIYFYENTSAADRIAIIDVQACDGIHSLKITQQGINTSVKNHQFLPPLIFPNPVKDNRVHIRLPIANGEFRCTLFDAMGKILHNEIFYAPECTLELQTPPGLYILKITGRGYEHNSLLSVE